MAILLDKMRRTRKSVADIALDRAKERDHVNRMRQSFDQSGWRIIDKDRESLKMIQRSLLGNVGAVMNVSRGSTGKEIFQKMFPRHLVQSIINRLETDFSGACLIRKKGGKRVKLSITPELVYSYLAIRCWLHGCIDGINVKSRFRNCFVFA